MRRLHRLTDEGIQRFQQFIRSQSTAEPEEHDIWLVTNPAFAVPVARGCAVETACQLPLRFDMARELSRIVRESSLTDPAAERGVWCWLAWLWFDSLCPQERDGRRKTGDSARWVLSLDWNRYYRHLLAGPWWIYHGAGTDPESARSLLCTEVAKPGELVEQIAARQELVSNRNLVAMLTRLFYDAQTRKLKKGVGGKGRGSARRLVDVLCHLDMVWDLYSASADELISLLPPEFDRYKVAF